MGIEELAAELERRRGGVVDVARRDRWTADLRALRERIHRWVRPLVDKGLVELTFSDIELVEPDLGAYMVPTLDLSVRTDDPVVVHLVPRGLSVAGALLPGGGRVVDKQGRVDLVAGAERAFLLRDDTGSWVVVSRSQAQPVGLDEETFTTAFRDILP